MSKDSVKQLSGHAGARQSISSVTSEVCKRIANDIDCSGHELGLLMKKPFLVSDYIVV